MPKHRNPFDKGQLIIKFEIEMPEILPEDALQTLSRVLPPPTRPEVPYNPNECEECILHKYEETAQRAESGRRGNDSDDDQDPGGQRAQCVHQ